MTPIPMTPNQVYKSSHLKGIGEIGNASTFLTPTTSYANLVAAPASGILRVNQIAIKNIDTAVTTDFYLKIVCSGTDYLVMNPSLIPGERFIVNFPFLLDSTTSIQAKVAATCAARITASCVAWEGEMGLVNFSGVSWTDVLTVPSGHAYSLLAYALQNSDTASQTISLQIIDGSSNVKWSESRTLGPGEVWINDENVVLAAGWKLQVKHGAASKTGSALASYLEVTP